MDWDLRANSVMEAGLDQPVDWDLRANSVVEAVMDQEAERVVTPG